MHGMELEAGARQALEIALGTAGAAGEERCGTEHLLFGVVATAEGDVRAMLDLFALDTLRVEWALVEVGGVLDLTAATSLDGPPLSPRAQIAVSAPSLSGGTRANAFDLLYGSLKDPRSGACTVLRHLGVRVGEVRRLAELGASRLGRDEVDSLVDALDRRDRVHNPWWGPEADQPVARLALPGDGALWLAGSETAVASLDHVVVGPDGWGFSATLTSSANWVLPPRWEPTESLTAQMGTAHGIDPDVVTVDVRTSDGGIATNRSAAPRFRPDPPDGGTLVLLGSRSTLDSRNDRRKPARRTDTADFWMWPLPTSGPVTIVVEWRAEAISGQVTLDADELVDRAVELHQGMNR